jgi:hypothetical protein
MHRSLGLDRPLAWAGLLANGAALLGLVLVPADRAATAAGLGGLWVLQLLLLLRWSLPRP